MLMNRTTPYMVPVDDANPAIIKNEALCSECGHCFAVCEEEIGVAAKYLLNQREAYQCIGCGQCSAVCPEKAITGRPHCFFYIPIRKSWICRRIWKRTGNLCTG